MKYPRTSRLGLLAAAAFATAALPGTAGAQALTPIDVVLIGGQSNAQGVKTQNWRIDENGPDAYARFPQDDIQFFFSYGNRDGEDRLVGWDALRPGSSSPTSFSGFGAELSLGRNIKDAQGTGGNLGIIKSTLGASSLHTDWSPTGWSPDDPVGQNGTVLNRETRQVIRAGTTGETYRRFLQATDAGLADLRDRGFAPTVTAMVWTHGETDTNQLSTALDYRDNLIAFLDDIRGRYNDDMLGLIAQLPEAPEVNFTGQKQLSWDTVQQAQADAAAADPLNYLVSTVGLQTYDDDLVHFNNDGQLRLGERYAAAYNRGVSAIPEPATAAVLVLMSGAVLRRRTA